VTVCPAYWAMFSTYTWGWVDISVAMAFSRNQTSRYPAAFAF
jgi:hypothetical protein